MPSPSFGVVDGTTINLLELANRLPTPASDPPALLAPQDAYRRNPSEVLGYEWPTLRLDGETLNPLVLVDSPGAMGKSAAAAMLARQISAPLLNVGGLHVGAHTLTGLLVSALGHAGYSRLMTALTSGDRCLVIDGFDEALLRSGAVNYQAFLDDLGRLVGQCKPGAVIGFGRPESALLAETVLSQGQVTRAELIPLNSNQLRSFIDKRLDNTPRATGAHRNHRAPFENLRDYQIEALESALSAEVDPQAFLGYTPVSASIAALLDVENPQAELSRLQSLGLGETAKERGAMLLRIVESILDRDQLKVQQSLDTAIPGAHLQELDAYNRTEQVIRLLANTVGSSPAVLIPAKLDDSYRQVYEDRVGDFSSDHPFRFEGEFASAVFSDYVRAFAQTSAPATAALPGIESDPSHLPAVGPFYALFYAELTRDENGLSHIPTEETVADLLSSNRLGSRTAPLATYTHIRSTASLTIEPDTDAPSLTFRVDSPTGILSVPSGTSNLLVTSTSSVEIGQRNGVSDLGPNATIVAKEIEIQGGILRVGPIAAQGPVVLAGSDSVRPKSLEIDARADDLLVRGAVNAFPWHRYLQSSGRTSSFLTELLGSLVAPECRRILRRFSGGGNPPNVYRELLDNRLVAGNDLTSAVMKALLDDSVISVDGDFYVLNLSRLADYQIHREGLTRDWKNMLAPLSQHLLTNELLAGYLAFPGLGQD